ncbi:protein of unknown function [Microlunatus sagamiharensis]|uniref:DUF4261 domain-containing protein n=1 Tax=Microlunatus sagamiharensis TaxID=546874 RepID=A0A1H2LPN1_9ACTN|nr:DUF4261 domain-containing protein [Microlunatus sagamiharensis]SDU82802.1 protein of unknown function [Microlunatus sagamiharensis]
MTEPEGLIAELWYETAPDLTDPMLLEGLRAVSPGTEVQDGSLVVPYDGGELAPRPAGDAGEPAPRRPLVSLVLPGSSLDEPGKSLPDTSQTWDWPGAEEALAPARASVLVVEMYGDAYTARDRAAALVGVVRALAVATRPVALSWPTSQRVSDPGEPAADGLGGLLNVRLFSVSDDEDELVMDTRGLAPFGLPDLQVHFRDLEPGRLGALLYATAGYLLEEGDVLGEGHTISGIESDDRWTCHHEDSLIGPSRRVVDIDPGDPYAAGKRAR